MKRAPTNRVRRPVGSSVVSLRPQAASQVVQVLDWEKESMVGEKQRLDHELEDAEHAAEGLVAKVGR